MAYFALVVPVTIFGFKAVRSMTQDDNDTKSPMSGYDRKNSVAQRLMAGRNPPVASFSEAHLEKMIKTNSAMQEHGDELRECRRKSLGLPPAPAVDQNLMGA